MGLFETFIIGILAGFISSVTVSKFGKRKHDLLIPCVASMVITLVLIDKQFYFIIPIIGAVAGLLGVVLWILVWQLFFKK